MSRNIKLINSTEKKRTLTALHEAAKQMDGPHPATTFIRELLTESEQIKLGRRILIAQMILAGIPQIEIRSQLNVSPNTFIRTRKWLEGQLPHYDDALKEFARNEKNKQKTPNKRKKTYFDSTTLAGLQQRYPAHFLLYTLTEKLFTQHAQNKNSKV